MTRPDVMAFFFVFKMNTKGSVLISEDPALNLFCEILKPEKLCQWLFLYNIIFAHSLGINLAPDFVQNTKPQNCAPIFT